MFRAHKRFLAIIAIGLGLYTPSFGQTAPAIRGREAEAVALTVKTFKSKQGTFYAGWPVYGDLKHYTLELLRHHNTLEITFVPDQPKLKRNEAGTGGGTKYGWDVHYVVSLDPLRIVKEEYAR